MEREMNLLEIFQTLKKRFSVLLLIMIGFTLLGGGASFLLNEKVYTSTASLIVGDETEKETGEYNEINGEPIYETVIQYGNTSISAQSIKFYNDVLSSSDLLEEVIEKLNLDVTVEDFRELISLEVPEDSGSMFITVKGPHLDDADQIANEVVTVFQEKVFEITEIERIKTMNSASEPKITNTVNIIRNILVSIAGGFIVGAVVVLVLEYLDDSIQSEKEIEEKLGISVIGKIRTEETIEEDLKNIRTYMEFSPKFKDRKAIVVTTPTQQSKNISVGLANVLTEADKKILLMDADFRQPSIQDELGLSNGEGLSDVLKEDINLTDVTADYKNNQNYQVVIAGTSLKQPSEYLSSNKFKQLLAEERNNFDYIIVNGHPVNGVIDTVALSTFADGVILVVKTNTTKVAEVKEVQKKFTAVGVNILGIVLSEI